MLLEVGRWTVGLRYVGWSLLAGKQVQTRRSQRTGESSPKGGEGASRRRKRKKHVWTWKCEGGGIREKKHT